MRPTWAAVAGFGAGMLWPHARLGGPVPRVALTWASPPRRSHRSGLLPCCGIGAALLASGPFAAPRSWFASPPSSTSCTDFLMQLLGVIFIMERWLAAVYWPQSMTVAAHLCRCTPSSMLFTLIMLAGSGIDGRWHRRPRRRWIFFLAHRCSLPHCGIWAPAVRGPLRLGMGAHVRSYTVLAMRPARAAVAWLGNGSLLPHLGGLPPWRPSPL